MGAGTTRALSAATGKLPSARPASTSDATTIRVEGKLRKMGFIGSTVPECNGEVLTISAAQ